MQPSRRSQPYRRGQSRQGGEALAAMLKGRSAWGQNPMDLRRAFQRQGRLRRAFRVR